MFAHVRPDEWRFVGLVSCALLVVTAAPYVYAAVSAPADKHFVGFILDVPDHAEYLAWYRGFQGASLIPNTLTSEANSPLFFNLLWWVLARFGLYTTLHYAVVYQLFRCLAAIFFLGMVYVFASWVFTDVVQRKTAFLVTALSGGFGWALVVLKYTIYRGEMVSPLDLYIAEGNSLLCIMAFPHFIEAAGLILLIFWLLIAGAHRRGVQLRYAVAAGVVAQLLGWQHGYDLLIVWVIPAAYTAVRWILDGRMPRYWAMALTITVLLSWPPALYAVLLTRLDPLWGSVLHQYANAGVFSPSPPHMFILIGVPLVVALITVLLQARRRSTRGISHAAFTEAEMFVVTWFIAGWALVYVPTDFQVHMINSWQVPIALLATMGLFRYVVPLVERRRWRWGRSAVAACFVLVTLPTNLYLWAWRFYDLHRHDYPYYLHRDDVAALRWLDEQGMRNAVVLSANYTGEFVPSLGGDRAFLGHWAQTVDFYEKQRLVSEFFARDTADARRRQILADYQIDYVLQGPAEKALGSYRPADSDFLTVAFSAPQTTVYAVGRSPGSALPSNSNVPKAGSGD